MQAPSFISIAGLARLSARRPWLVVTAWVLAILVAIGAMGALGDSTTTEMQFLDNPESAQGTDLLVDSGLRTEDPITETVIIRGETGTVDDPAVREVVEQMTTDLRALTGIRHPGERHQLLRGRAGLRRGQRARLRGSADDADPGHARRHA